MASTIPVMKGKDKVPGNRILMTLKVFVKKHKFPLRNILVH